MEIDRREVLALSGALAYTALAGCIGEGATPATNPETATGTPTGTSMEGAADVDDERIAELAAGNAAFALELHRHLSAETDGNLFLSPYSISAALAMTFAGAGGETREEMHEALHYTLDEEIHPAFADLQAELEARARTESSTDEEEIDAFRLNVAGAIWGREDYPFAKEYLDLLAEYYTVGLRRADFASDPGGERERINEWVTEATERKVEELLPPDAVTSETVMILTNAIYFSAGWQFGFDPKDTKKETFTALDGTVTKVSMMNQELRTNYASVRGADVIELPYIGKEVSIMLILPPEGKFEAFESDLTADRLFTIFDALDDASGDLALPRFEYRSEFELSRVLTDLGLASGFTPEADFSRMVENGDGPWIDDVYHEAFVSVDEEGTEAAAATAVGMAVSVPKRSFEISFNRPFLFCIYDRPTDAVLFLGRVIDAGTTQE